MINISKPCLEDTKELNKMFDAMNITSFSANIQKDGSTFLSFDRELNHIKEETKVELPEEYDIREDVSTLYWKDGTKTTVKRCENDEFNERLAFLTAFFQKYSGMSKNKANKYLSNLKVSYPLNRKKEGKLVKVISIYKTYTLYATFVSKYFPSYISNFKPYSMPVTNKAYLFIGEAKHDCFDKRVCLIQDRDTKQVYVIDKEGIKDYQPKQAKEEFKIGDRVYHQEFGWGIIVEIKDKQMFCKYLVLFDNTNLILHSGSVYANRSYPEHRCWWCQDKDISKEGK